MSEDNTPPSLFFFSLHCPLTLATQSQASWLFLQQCCSEISEWQYCFTVPQPRLLCQDKPTTRNSHRLRTDGLQLRSVQPFFNRTQRPQINRPAMRACACCHVLTLSMCSSCFLFPSDYVERVEQAHCSARALNRDPGKFRPTHSHEKNCIFSILGWRFFIIQSRNGTCS